MKPITTILFDMDNTLIDRQAAATNLMRRIVMNDFGSTKSTEEIENIIADLMIWDKEGSIPKEQVFNHYLEEYPQEDKSWEMYDQLWFEYLGDYTVAFPRSIEVLETLSKKYTLGMITNGNSKTQRVKIRNFGGEKYFSKIIVSGEMGMHKPDLRLFTKMCELLGVEADECAFVGDSLQFDMVGAINAGMKPIWIYPDPNKSTELEVTRIYHIEELLEVL